MSTNKQAREVQRYAQYGVDMMEWSEGGYVLHSDYLALLDELEAKEKYANDRDAENEDLMLTVGRLRVEREAAEKRIAELEDRPTNPINFKENADADYCRGWAWNEVKKELASEAWTVGDNCTFYGFFCWGWDTRRQFNEQRAAGITVKGDGE